MKRMQIHSAGIVPVYEALEGPQVLLVEQQHGAEGTRWVFPKGKQELGEELIDTAKRELKEEAGLDVKKVVEHKPFQVEFAFTFNGEIADKVVTYFLGYVDKKNVKLCQNEIMDSGWFSFEEAKEKLTFDIDKELFDRVTSFYAEK